MKPNSYIGAAVTRLEDFRFLTGRGVYAGDLVRENMLHAVVVRSPLAHGRIRSIDCTNAGAMPGVYAIITARDIGQNVPRIPMRQEPMPELLPFEQPVIARDAVRYAGEPIALVLADSAARAEDAAAAVVADIEPLPVVMGSDSGTLLFAGTKDNIATRIAAVKGNAADAFRNHRVIRGANCFLCTGIPRRRWNRAHCSPNGMPCRDGWCFTARPKSRSPTGAFSRGFSG